MEEVRVKAEEWQQEAMRLRRRGMRIKLIQPEGDEVLLRFEADFEVRTEQPDTKGNASRRVDL